MKITEFCKLVSQKEGKKKELSIAQIGEVVRVVNELLDGDLYRLIRQKDVPGELQ